MEGEQEEESLSEDFTRTEYIEQCLSVQEACNCMTCIGPTFRTVEDKDTHVFPAFGYLAMEIIGKHITDITILPLFTHIVYVDLSKNLLKDESLQPLKQMQQLKGVVVDNNLIQSLASFPELCKLQLLSVKENYLTTCEVRQLESLLYLDMSYNNIDKIVPYLWCPYILPQLKELSLRGNRLRKLAGFLFSNLVSLFLAENQIRKIEGLQLLPKLKFLHLRKNPLTRLDGFSADNKQLFYLNIRDCEISKMSEFEKLNVLPRLQRIVVTGNPCWRKQNSKLKLIATLPRLRRINKEVVEDGERQDAKNITDEGDDDKSEEDVYD